MIEKIKLEKSNFGKLEDDEHDIPYWFYRIATSSNWVSNSHWAIHKNLIINADDFKNEETIKKYLQLSDDDEFTFQEPEDEVVMKLFPDIRFRFVNCREVVERDIRYMRFVGNGNYLVCFNIDYIKLFQITELWGEGLNPYVNMAKGEPTFIIAPCRL